MKFLSKNWMCAVALLALLALGVPVAYADRHSDLMEFMRVAGDPPVPQLRYYKSAAKGSALVLGISHSKDPADPQFGRIKSSFHAFEPTFVLNEGGNWPVYASEEEAIRQGGAAGLLKYLGVSKAIPCESADPSFTDEVNHVRKKFGLTETKIYYVLRYYTTIKNSPDWNSKLSAFLVMLSDRAGLLGSPGSVAELSDVVPRIFGIADWTSLVTNDVSPIGNGSARQPSLTDIAKFSVEFREDAAASKVADLVARGERVFLAYGLGHLISQERQLRCAIEGACGH